MTRSRQAHCRGDCFIIESLNILLFISFPFLCHDEDRLESRVARWHIFKPKNLNLVKFLRVLQWTLLVYFMAL
jgi:hypothetical protein